MLLIKTRQRLRCAKSIRSIKPINMPNMAVGVYNRRRGYNSWL